MIRKNKTAKKLEGFFCLPTSARAHVLEPQRSSAFKEGQTAFVLTATQSVEDGGYPHQVVVYADDGELDWSVGQEVRTQHAEVRKNLPPRKVTGIVYGDGLSEGELPPKGLGLPHWQLIPANGDGSANLAVVNATGQRIEENKARAKAEKERIREAKKGGAASRAA